MKRTGTIVIALILFLSLVPGALALPPLPCDFWGSVTINGQPAAAGTTITALIDEKVCGQITTTEAGKYGTYVALGEKLMVEGSDGDAGKTIRFKVSGTYAGQTATFIAGDARSLDLSVSTGGGGSPSGGGDRSYTPTESSIPTVKSVVGTGPLQTTSTGTVTESVAVTTEDSICMLTVTSGVVVTGADGKPIQEVTVEARSESSVPPVSGGAVYAFAGHVVECGPSGAQFDPAVPLSFTLSEEEWSQLSGADLSVGWYDESAGTWVSLPVEVDAVTRTVTAKVSHFSVFALLTKAKGESVPSQTATVISTGAQAGESTSSAPAGEAATGTGSGSLPWAALIGIPLLIVVVVAVCYWRNKKSGS